jgi:hypothetical protein
MKRLLLAVLVALAVPAAADAKELTGFRLCGPDGCAGGKLSGFGHDGPFDPAGAGYAPPAPGEYYTLVLEVDGHSDAWTVYYEPRTGHAAYTTEHAWMTWSRLAPELAGPVKDAAKQIAPFARPTISRVRIAGREVSGDLDSYLRLFELDGRFAVQGDGESDVIDLDSARPNPWTDAQLLYYPEDDIVQVSAGRTIRVPSGLASDIEAARPLGDGDGLPVLPVVALAAAALGLATVAVAIAEALRKRPDPRPATQPETA